VAIHALPSLPVGVLLLLVSLGGVWASIYHAVRAWRSSPAQWVALSQHQRPRSWRRWPAYSWLWRDVDRHGTLYMWQARLLAPVGVVGFSLGVYLSALAILLRVHSQ
jgi:hypothetical protein